MNGDCAIEISRARARLELTDGPPVLRPYLETNQIERLMVLASPTERWQRDPLPRSDVPLPPVCTGHPSDGARRTHRKPSPSGEASATHPALVRQIVRIAAIIVEQFILSPPTPLHSLPR